MRPLAISILFLCAAACGGPPTFRGDDVVAELRNGQPYCSPGRTGPTVKDSIVTVTDRNGQPLYDSHIHECDWTCGNIGAESQSFVYVIFYTDQNGAWTRDPYADPSRGSCPTD